MCEQSWRPQVNFFQMKNVQTNGEKRFSFRFVFLFVRQENRVHTIFYLFWCRLCVFLFVYLFAWLCFMRLKLDESVMHNNRMNNSYNYYAYLCQIFYNVPHLFPSPALFFRIEAVRMSNVERQRAKKQQRVIHYFVFLRYENFVLFFVFVFQLNSFLLRSFRFHSPFPRFIRCYLPSVAKSAVRKKDNCLS